MSELMKHLLMEKDVPMLHCMDKESLWVALRKLARLVRGAEPIVARELNLVSELTLAPLLKKEKEKHDATLYPCEIWLAEFFSLVDDDFKGKLASTNDIQED